MRLCFASLPLAGLLLFACSSDSTETELGRDANVSDGGNETAVDGSASREDAAAALADVIPAGDAGALAVRSGAPFGSSVTAFSARANEFWSIYGAGDAVGDFSPTPAGLNTAWNEWDARKFCWTKRNGQQDKLIDVLLNHTKINGLGGATGIMPNGFVWSWGDLESWPDQDAKNHGGTGSMHFDQLPRYFTAVALLSLWTGDKTLRDTLLQNAEYVFDNYVVAQMGGGNGVLTISHAANDGTGGRPSTYMDQIRSGYQDAWINAAYISALQSMFELETLAGNSTRAAQFQALTIAFSAKFDAAFWDDSNHRFVGWRDKNGTRHDSGYTLINLEALARGLGDPSKAQYVFDWLASPAAPSAGGVHAGSTDVFQHVMAPRANTLPIPAGDLDGWSDPVEGPKPYGTLVENGGTLLFENYYDTLARLRYADADAAFGSLNRMLDRFASDSHRLTFTGARHYDDFGEDFVEIGTNIPFPESGQAILPLLDGFVGASAVAGGLSISPNLPQWLLDLHVREMSFQGSPLSVSVSRGTSFDSVEEADGVLAMEPGETLSQTFTASHSFDEVQVLLGTYAQAGVLAMLRLERLDSSGISTVATRRVPFLRDNHWLPLVSPMQAPGNYRITVEGASGTLAWYRDSKNVRGGAVQNGSPATGSYAFRAVSTFHETTLSQTSSPIAEALTTTQGQTFQTATPFDRILIRVLAADAGGGFTATLSRDVGGRWASRQIVDVRDIRGEREIALPFALEAGGKYWLELTNPTGTIAWRRSDVDTIPGDGLYALDGLTPLSGDRSFEILRPRYRVTVPEKSIDVLVRGGASVLIPR